ncbi:MAG TPA: hypothetical protein VFZ17_09550 [Acidimicrobiia bacterium]|nr:hypothetical protein [Acidimicrobiia bacterium]
MSSLTQRAQGSGNEGHATKITRRRNLGSQVERGRHGKEGRVPEKLTTSQSRRTPWFMGTLAVVLWAVAASSTDNRATWLVSGGALGVLSLRYLRAGAFCSDSDLTYRGIVRTWRLGWDGIAGFDKTRWYSEGVANEFPVALVAQSGSKRPSRRRMYALGSRPARNDEASEVDELIKQLEAHVAAHRRERNLDSTD